MIICGTKEKYVELGNKIDGQDKKTKIKEKLWYADRSFGTKW